MLILHMAKLIQAQFTFISPVQDCPSPVNPALHVQVKEPILFWQTALASQGEERHSLISMHRNEIHKKNNQQN